MKFDPHNRQKRIVLGLGLWALFSVTALAGTPGGPPGGPTQKMEIKDFRQQFEIATVFTEDGFYEEALPIWERLLQKYPDNANLNYQVGLCYMHLPDRAEEAEALLKKAIHSTDRNYYVHFKENSAPVEAIFELGRFYHHRNDLESAIQYYSQYKNSAHRWRGFRKKAEHHIEMCKAAMDQLQHPEKVSVFNANSLNSKFSEYCPIPSTSGDTLYFTSRRPREKRNNTINKDLQDGMFFENIYYSVRTPEGYWAEPTLMSFCGVYEHETVSAISSDGKTLYLSRSKGRSTSIFVSHFKRGRWTRPVEMEGGINSRRGHETHLTFGADDNTIYFISDRRGGHGKKDIYMSTKRADGKWGKPKNLGRHVNSKYDEESPFFDAVSNRLYFSSRGHNTMGGFDVFYTELDDYGNWSKPVNVGFPVNTTGDDVSYIMLANQQHAWYASNSGDKSGMDRMSIFSVEWNNPVTPPPAHLMASTSPNYADVPSATSPVTSAYNQLNQFKAANSQLSSFNDIIRQFEGMQDNLPEDLSEQLSAVKQAVEVMHEELVGLLDQSQADNVDRIDIVQEKIVEMTEALEVIREELVGFVDEEQLEFLDRVEALREIEKHVDREVKVTEIVEVEVEKEVTVRELVEIEVEKIVEKLKMVEMETEVLVGEIEPEDVAFVDKVVTRLPPSINMNLIFFHQHFGFNQRTVDQEDPSFSKLVDDLSILLQTQNEVTIGIESCASKVPTKSYTSNEEIAQLRANRAIQDLKTALEKRGADVSKLKVGFSRSFVEGPEYDKSVHKDLKQFQKFQYVKIALI